MTGVADANLVDEEYRISHVISGVRARTGTNWFMNVTRTDNDRANLDLGTTTALTVAEGGSTSYDIKLTQQPTATVTLTVTATGNDDVRFSTDSCSTLTTTGTLTFTTSNWDTAQSLTVCGAEDYDASDDTATLTYSASGGGYGSLNYPATGVTVTDDDEETIEISPTAIDITEGDGVVVTGTYERQPERGADGWKRYGGDRGGEQHGRDDESDESDVLSERLGHGDDADGDEVGRDPRGGRRWSGR